MEIHLPAERQAQLDDYAQRHGQDAAAALDEVLAAALEWERQDYHEAVEGIRKGYADFKAGRVRPVEGSFARSEDGRAQRVLLRTIQRLIRWRC